MLVLFYTVPAFIYIIGNKYHLALISEVGIWKVLKLCLLPRWNFILSSSMCHSSQNSKTIHYCIKWRDSSGTIDGFCGRIRGIDAWTSQQIRNWWHSPAAARTMRMPPRGQGPSPIHHHFCKWRNNMSCAEPEDVCCRMSFSHSLSLSVLVCDNNSPVSIDTCVTLWCRYIYPPSWYIHGEIPMTHDTLDAVWCLTVISAL